MDLFVEMCETGILSYVKPEQCCSRAQEVQSIKKDPAVSMDSAGMLKLGSKVAEPVCEANTELKLRSAWQRRNLAMDLAGLATFSVMEGWTQLLFSHLLREQPRGLAKVSLQQLLDCVIGSCSQWLHTIPWATCVRVRTNRSRWMQR